MCLKYSRMSIGKFINMYKGELNKGMDLWKIWKSRVVSRGDKYEAKQKEIGRLANIIMNGKKWNYRAVANNYNKQELENVEEAMQKWKELYPKDENNSPSSTSRCSDSGCVISGGVKRTHKRHHTKSYRTRHNRTKRRRN